MFCSWGTRPAEVPKGDRGRSGRKVADPNTTHNKKVVHFGGGSGRQPGRGSGTVARGGPGRGRREVDEEAREDIRESTTTTNPTARLRRRRRGRFRILSFVCPEVGLGYRLGRLLILLISPPVRHKLSPGRGRHRRRGRDRRNRRADIVGPTIATISEKHERRRSRSHNTKTCASRKKRIS